MKKVKHDHKGTKALKLTIFFSLMLAPMLAVLFKCCYVTFNKNAKDSYYGETINDSSLEQVNELEINNQYRFISNTTAQTTNDSNAKIVYEELNNISLLPNNTTLIDNINNSSYFTCTYYSTTNYIVFYDSNDSQTQVINLINYSITFDFKVVNYSTGTHTFNEVFDNYIYEVQYNKYSYLDNAFYYAVDEMKNNQLFNWTTNTALYTPTATMTTGMGITTTALPILITYWLYLTAIYIVIDIVVELFTYLTHMITSRMES